MPNERKGLKSQIKNDQRKNAARRKPKAKKVPGRMQIYGSAYNQLHSDVSWLLSMVNTETKYVDAGGIFAFTGAWQITLLNGLTTGTSSTTRIGQSIKLVGIEFKCFVTMNPLATAISSYRVVIVKDKQCNAAALTGTDVYPAGSTSFRTVSYLDRFDVIWEKWAILDVEFPTGEIEQFSKKVEFHVDFNTGTAGTIADITKNSLYMIVYSDAGVNYPQMHFASRVVFVDN